MDGTNYRLRTLIVDDDPDSAIITRRALGLTGCFDIIGRAVDAHDAHLLAQTLAPDLILLDVEMPGADGFSALPYIQEASPRSHIVMVSGADPQTTRRRAAAMQVDYVPKDSPLSVFEMLGQSLIRGIARPG
jgi:DNA-binding NarL/FixJ family response regulator